MTKVLSISLNRTLDQKLMAKGINTDEKILGHIKELLWESVSDDDIIDSAVIMPENNGKLNNKDEPVPNTEKDDNAVKCPSCGAELLDNLLFGTDENTGYITISCNTCCAVLDNDVVNKINRMEVKP